MHYPVYCINLLSRPDRKKHTEKEFKKLGIKNVIYPIFTKDERGGNYGVYDSHIKIWKDFYKNHKDFNYCLIFEDDFVSNKESMKYIEEGEKFIKNNYYNIDILNLHHYYSEIDNRINNKIFKNGFGSATHAYFITRSYIENIYIKHKKIKKPNGNHIDTCINLIFTHDLYSEKIFFSKKECFLQLDDFSDNNWNNYNINVNNAMTYNNLLYDLIRSFNISLSDTKRICSSLASLKNI